MWNPFKRKNYASPYYGKGNRALFTSPMPPMPLDQPQQVKTNNSHLPEPSNVPPPPKPAEPDWEQRRFELVSRLMCQERRSVILGKLQATPKQIANYARVQADAVVKELMNHPMKTSDDTGTEGHDE
jgi:hypothetical protein